MNFKISYSSSSFKAVKDIFKLLPSKSFNPLCILVISNLLSGLIEFFIIILFVPLTSIVLNPEIKPVLKLPAFFNNFNYFFSDNLFVYLFILLIFLSFVLKILSNFFTLKFSAKFATYLSSLVYESFLNEPFEISNSRHSSFLYDLLGPKINATVAIMDRFLFLLSNLVISFFIVYALLNISLKLTIFGIFGFAIFYFLLIKSIRPTLLNNSQLQSELTSQSAQLATDTSLGLRDIILQNKFTKIIASYLNFDRKIRKSVVVNNLLSLTPKFALEFFIILIFPLLIIFKNIFSFDYLLVSILGAFFLGLQKLLPSFQMIYSSYTTINSNIFALREIKTFLKVNKSKLIKAKKLDILKKKNKIIKFESLIFRSVYFSYKNSNSFSIENLSFEINSGDIVLIDGPSGIGKSTTVDLIAGLLRPTSGDILLNNSSLNDVSNNQLVYDWRYSLSYVSQEPYFPSSSIARIVSGTDLSGSIDKDLVLESIKIACLEDFIYSLPNGINTLLDQNAKNLSGGQRQRLAFARALYKKPSFMILDEFTSAIDKKIESKILRNIKSLAFKTTIILISHKTFSDNYFNKTISIKGVNK